MKDIIPTRARRFSESHERLKIGNKTSTHKSRLQSDHAHERVGRFAQGADDVLTHP